MNSTETCQRLVRGRGSILKMTEIAGELTCFARIVTLFTQIQQLKIKNELEIENQMFGIPLP